MKVIVFGTSNALMQKGWVNAILEQATRQGVEIINHSIGGASSRLGAFLTAEHGGLEAADAIVYDFAIPDQMFRQAGWLTQEDIDGHHLTILRDLIRRDALHKALFLLFPQQSELMQSPLLDRIASLLAELGADFVDFRPVLAEVMTQTGWTPEQVYADPRHYAPQVQACIGQHVLDRLMRPSAPPPRRLTPAAARLSGLPPAGYRRLEVQAPPDGAVQDLGTRLVRFAAHVLRDGDSLHITGAPYLIGALIWAQENSGTLTLYGEDEADAIRLHFRRIFRNMFLFDSLSAPLPLGSQARAVMVNDGKARNQRAMGLSVTDYDRTNATCELVFLLGCDIPPAAYLELYGARRAPHRQARRLRPWLAGLLRPWLPRRT